MHYHLFYRVYRRVVLGRRVYIASVQVYTVRVHSVVPSRHSVGIENRKQVEYKLVSEDSTFLTVFSQFTDDSCHHVRAWNLSRMNSCPNNDTFFFWAELSRLIFVWKEMLVIELFSFISDPFFGGDGEKVDGPAFEGPNDIRPFKVYVLLLSAFFLDFFQELVIVSIGPRVKEGDEYFLVGGDCMFKGPLNPTLVIFLSYWGVTIFERSILWATLLHSLLFSSLKTGTRPSLSNLDWVLEIVPDFACSWCWRWEECLCWILWLKNETKSYTDF